MLPVGAFEQHGPYLPLVTDTLIATAVAEAINLRHKIFQLPAVTFGCSHEHSAFPGTISLSPATLAAVVTDICTSLVQQGIRALMVVNGHGGNYVLGNVVQQANTDGAMRVGLYPSRADWTEARRAADIASSNHDDMHAGELETSILLAAHPAYVRDGWDTTITPRPTADTSPPWELMPTPPVVLSGIPRVPAPTRAKPFSTISARQPAISSPCSPSSRPRS